MAAKRKFKSEAFEAIHSSVSALHKVGAIDQTTMRSFDASCLASPLPLKPQQIKKLRQRLRVSQPVFARYLNTSEVYDLKPTSEESRDSVESGVWRAFLSF